MTTQSSPEQLVPKLRITLAGRLHLLETEHAFSLAHQLLCRANLDAATSILAWLDVHLPYDRRIAVLRARCEARKGNFGDCSRRLCCQFADAGPFGDVAGPLHTAIVYRATGLLPDARKELDELCEIHPELPSLWLMAGDLWCLVGRPDKARIAWKKAVKKDSQAPMLVGVAARHRVQELVQRNHPRVEI